jgi:lambda family phage tail tape measure protein
MANLGSLVVSLEANIARFTSDMGRAADQTQQAMSKMQGAVNMVKGAMGALGVGISVLGLASLVKDAIDAADNLRDMSQKTGVAVETLNGLGFAAGQAGGSLESVVDAAGKVNKAVAEAAGGNEETSEAFKVLGINVRDAAGNLKTADVVMAEVADQFKKYADGPEKSAIALRIFGKAGADMIPFLNDGGDAMRENIEYAKKYSEVTDELANGSDNFNDTMGKLTIQQKSFGNALAAQVLPLLQLVADEILGASEKSDKFAFASNAVRLVLETFLVTGSEVAFVFKAVGTEIGGIAAQLVALAQRDFKGFTAIGDAMKADAEVARKEHDAFIASILERPVPVVAPSVDDETDKKKNRAPALKKKVAVEDVNKGLMDGQLKEIQAAYAAERDTANYHDKYMQELRGQDVIDLQTYEAYKIAAIDNGAANAVRAYDKEIKVLRASRATAAKETERVAIDNKIGDVQAKKEKALRDAQQDRTMVILAQSSAQSGLNKSLGDWTLQQTQAMGQFQFEIDLYGKTTLEANKLTAARRIYLDVEERIRQAQENSATPINRAAFDAERDKAIAASNALYDQADAKQSDPWFNMTESVRRYGEDAANTGTQIGNAMSNSFQTAEDAFVQFTTTGKLNFKSMASSIIADFARIEARKGMSSLLSMGMSALGSYFGAPAASAGNYTFTPTNLDTSLPFLDSIAGARATGGSVLGNSAYLVGERGPEIFRPTGAGSITPNNQIGGGGGVTISMVTNIEAGSADTQATGDANGQQRAAADALNAKMKQVVMQESRQGGIIWNLAQGRG